MIVDSLLKLLKWNLSILIIIKLSHDLLNKLDIFLIVISPQSSQQFLFVDKFVIIVVENFENGLNVLLDVDHVVANWRDDEFVKTYCFVIV